MQNDLFSITLDDLKKFQDMKNFSNENEEKDFYNEISLKAMILTDDGLKTLFNLSDDEFNQPAIQNAIKQGELLSAIQQGEQIQNAAKNGEKWAIIRLQEMNKGKQKQQITTRTVKYENSRDSAYIDAEKTSIFAQWANN